MIKRVDIETFLKLNINDNIPIIDVRSPIEYNHAHIPRAHNVYLFSDEERKEVGITYKQKGREGAILRGLDFVGYRMRNILESINNICLKYNSENKILMHCFRGGMRSESVAWLCSTYKYDVYVLEGGYKKFRNFVLNSFNRDYKINILTGQTGSSKTLILNKLKNYNCNIIDLEKLANHKGSAFGSINEKEQPSQEQFENNLAIELYKSNENSTIWFEDESLLIGKRVIPKSLFNKMQNANKVFYLNVPKDRRVKYIVDTYGKYNIKDLENGIYKIQKRLGGERTKKALEYLYSGDIYNCVIEILYYYDKVYKLSIDNIINIDCNDLDYDDICKLILNQV